MSRVEALSSNESRLSGGGVLGNERLTAANGAILILLLAALGITIVRIKPLIDVHLFLGLLLLPPVAVKLASTGYRFARYYSGGPSYRQRGAPPIVMRVLGPLVVASTLAVFATGIALLAQGPSASGILGTLHKASFIVWIACSSPHVLGHLPDLPRVLLRQRGGRYEYNPMAAGGVGRILTLTGAIVAGALLATLLIPHFVDWSHFEAVRRHER